MLIDTDLEKDITRRLMAALQQDEFLLYAQNIVPLVPQRQNVRFQEIYVRFQEEDAKLLPPGSFFPVLEECHMLPYLDRWVVNRLARWVRAGLKLKPDWKTPRCNINLADETIADSKFADYVAKYADDSYLANGVLGFDISCGNAIAKRGSMLNLIGALRPYGCTFTFAGFDGSESTLAKLEPFEPDFIKFSAAGINPAKVPEINRLCHGLGAKTIAEHIEHNRVLEHLRRCKVDFGQGYSIGPVEAL